MDRITVIIVDDHPIFRQGVADALSLAPDFDIVAVAENGEDGLELIRLHQPRVAIVDLNLPGMNGFQMTREVVSSHLPTRVVILTAYADMTQKIQGLHHGAAAYCSKGIQPDSLAQVIRAVAAGRYWIDDCEYLSEELHDWLEKQSAGIQNKAGEPGGPPLPLSPREMEILTYLTRGMSNKEIAAQLGLSRQTVKNHVTAILHKLGVKDRTQAALSALQFGWVRLKD